MKNRQANNSRSMVIFGSVALLIVGIFATIQVKKYRTQHGLSARQSKVVEFKQKLLPLYQQKAQLIQGFLKEKNQAAPQVESILLHIPNWNPVTYRDLEEMQEVVSYLDTHFSNYYVTKTLMQERKSGAFHLRLESLEREIRSVQEQIFPSKKNAG